MKIFRVGAVAGVTAAGCVVSGGGGRRSAPPVHPTEYATILQSADSARIARRTTHVDSVTTDRVFTDTVAYRRLCVVPPDRVVDLRRPCVFRNQGRELEFIRRTERVWPPERQVDRQ